MSLFLALLEAPLSQKSRVGDQLALQAKALESTASPLTSPILVDSWEGSAVSSASKLEIGCEMHRKQALLTAHLPTSYNSSVSKSYWAKVRHIESTGASGRGSSRGLEAQKESYVSPSAQGCRTLHGTHGSF